MAVIGYYPEFDFDKSGDHDAVEIEAINRALGSASPFLPPSKRREDERKKGDASHDTSQPKHTAAGPV